MYPRFIRSFGISKETTLADAICLDGFSFEETTEFFSNIVATQENAVMLGSKYYGLPDFDELLDKINI